MKLYYQDQPALDQLTASMRRRTAAHVNGGFTTDMGPQAMVLDAAIYKDPARFNQEMEHIFGKLPLLACLSTDIPNPGSTYLFREVGPEVIIARNTDGSANAFLNICPHRGAAVVSGCGEFKRFSCPFHGWTFDLSGKLIGLPGEVSFAGIDRLDRGLVRLPCQEWNGLIFIQLSAAADSPAIETYLAGLSPQLALIDFTQFRRVKTDRIDVAANWKTALDTYLECYHFADLHRDGLGQVYMADVMIHDDFSPHCRLVYTCKDYLEYAAKPESEWPKRHYEGVHLIFPNTILDIHNLDGVPSIGTYRLFPDGDAGRAFSIMTTYAPRELPPGRSVDEWIAGHDTTVNTVRTEDYVAATTAWRNLARNQGKTTFVLGRNEVAIQNLERNLARACHMPLD